MTRHLPRLLVGAAVLLGVVAAGTAYALAAHQTTAPQGDQVSSTDSSTRMPNLVLSSAASAKTRIASLPNSPDVTTQPVASDAPRGTVVAQVPAAGSTLTPGIQIKLMVSKGTGQ